MLRSRAAQRSFPDHRRAVQDREDALVTYRTLVAEYPSSSLGDDALWSADRAAPAGTPDRLAEHGGLRLVPDLEPAASAEPPTSGAVALEADTSQVVSRLAQLLREDPSLASSWGREAPDS